MNLLHLSGIVVLVVIAITYYYTRFVNIDSQLFYYTYNNDVYRLIELTTINYRELYTQTTTLKKSDYYYNNFNAIPQPVLDKLCSLRDPSGNTLLHWAAKAHAVDTATFLIDTCNCDHTIGNQQGTTPVLWAATYTKLNPTIYPEYDQVDDLLRDYHDRKVVWEDEKKDRLIKLKLSHSLSPDQKDDELDQLEYQQYFEAKQLIDDELPEPMLPTSNEYAKIELNQIIQLFYRKSVQNAIIAQNRISNTTKTTHEILDGSNLDSTQLSFDELKKLYTNDNPDLHHQTALTQLFTPNGSGMNILHFSVQFLTPSVIKTLLHIATTHNDKYLAQLIQQQHQQQTYHDQYTPLHYIPENCHEDSHCKKLLTLFVTLGADLKVENAYKRNVQHHLNLNKITPLLSPEDEKLILDYKQVLNGDKPQTPEAQVVSKVDDKNNKNLPDLQSPDFIVSRKKR